MAESGLDLSAELAKSGVKLRNLAEQPELQSGLLAEILGKLSSCESEGVQLIEKANIPAELLAATPRLVENVKASPSHLDDQIGAIVDKLKDKAKYPNEELGAKALLEKGIATSEQGYLGYVARQKYETIALDLHWDPASGKGTAKEFIDNYLSENPANSKEIRQRLFSLDPNSSLEVALSSTHSATAFLRKMRQKWSPPSPETTPSDPSSQIESGFLSEHSFPNTDTSDGREFNTQFLLSIERLRDAILVETKVKLDLSRDLLEQIRSLPHLKEFKSSDARALIHWIRGEPITTPPRDFAVLGGSLRELCGLKLLLAEQGMPETQIIPAINQALFPYWENRLTTPLPADFNHESPHLGWDQLDLDNATHGTLLRKLYDAEVIRHFKSE